MIKSNSLIFLLDASETNSYEIIIHVFLYWIAAPIYMNFFQFPFKETIVSHLFYARRESVTELTTCNTWLNIINFKFIYVLMIVWAISSIIKMYLIITYLPSSFTSKFVSYI
jgi:hypothetical protein